jgi:hypothetical protein
MALGNAGSRMKEDVNPPVLPGERARGGDATFAELE